jgi:hypothetical protein
LKETALFSRLKAGNPPIYATPDTLVRMTVKSNQHENKKVVKKKNTSEVLPSVPLNKARETKTAMRRP